MKSMKKLAARTLAVATLTCALWTPVPLVQAAPSVSEQHYIPYSILTQDTTMLNLINSEREKASLAPYALNDALCALAQRKAEDMRDNGYLAHRSPTLGYARDMVRNAGLGYTSVTENIAHHASIYKAHVALMSSAGHYRNLMSRYYTDIGIGVAYDAHGYPYICQIFMV